jgi:AcrR family transcriptional regulator
LIGCVPIEHDHASDVNAVSRRPYDGRRRAEAARATRRRILAAAEGIFGRVGYAGATMRAISDAAGVSVKTTEAAFGTKARLLKELIDTLIAGDDEPVAIADRPEMAAITAEPDPGRTLALYADLAAGISRRLAGISGVMEAAARTDPELAALYATNVGNRRLGAEAFVRTIAGKARLRVDETTAVDTVWLLNDPRTYRLLTQERGWSHERYIAWLVDIHGRLLLE